MLPFHTRILVIDDNDVCAKVLTRTITSSLKSDKFVSTHITVLSSAEAALHELRTSTYDIIFTDIEMTGMSGDDMVRNVRTRALDPHILESNRRIPIYAVTAKHDPKSRGRYESAGITECFEKAGW